MSKRARESRDDDPIQPLIEDALRERDKVTVRGETSPEPVKNPTARQLGLSCLFNSLFTVRSAAFLATRREFGPATSLVILGIEELGKATAYRWIDLGLFSTLLSDRGTRAYLEPAVLTCHQCKQRLVYICYLAPGVLKDSVDVERMEASMEALWNDPAADIDLDLPKTGAELWSRVEPKYRADKARAIELAGTFVEMGMLENLKWLGFYVEESKGLLRAPWLISRKTYEAMRTRYESLLRAVFPMMDPALPPEAEKAVSRLISGLTRLINQPIECEHSAGRMYRGKLGVKKWPTNGSDAGIPTASAVNSTPPSAPPPPP